MNNDYIINEITSYIDDTVYPNVETAQQRFAKALHRAMQQDGYDISYEEVYQQLPHAYWEATNMGHITSDDPYMEYAREELKDILLGKKAYDINQVTYTVEGSYETRDFTSNFKNTWQAFQKSKKKSANTAMGLAVEELVGEELEKNWREFSEPITSWVMDNMQIKQEGDDFKPGDLKIGKNNKLVGHIDIKYSTKGPDFDYRYMNMVHINENNENMPAEELAKLIEDYTYHGFKHRNNMVLIYVYPENGYWSTYVLNKVKNILIRHLKRANTQGASLKSSTVKQVWYGQYK